MLDFSRSVAESKSFLQERLQGLPKYLETTVTEISSVAGYDRPAWTRSVKSGTVKLDALFKLSSHYSIPMSYWFPSDTRGEDGTPIEVVVLKKQCLRNDIAPASYHYLQGLSAQLGVPIAEISKVAGYARSGWTRSVKSGTVKLVALLRLSKQYDIPMSYWFSPETDGKDGRPLEIGVRKKKCSCSDIAPASEEVLKLMKALSAYDKQQLLTLARKLSRQECV